MFRKILVLILEKQLAQNTIKLLKELAQTRSSKIYINSVIESSIIEGLAQTTGKRKQIIQDDQKGKRWYEAYTIEELFKEAGLFINLGVTEISGDPDLVALVNKSQCDLLVFCEPDEREMQRIQHLVFQVKTPILIIPRQ